MPAPFLSVIIPTLNEGAQIRSRLNALQALRGRATLLLVDGGSDDDTVEQALPLVDQLIDAPRGRALQMNAGAAASRGEVLLFLHADTSLPASAAGDIEAAIDAGAQWGRFDVRIEGTHRLLLLVARLMNWRSRRSQIATGDQAIFVRRDLFERVGGYPEQALMEDIALCRRLKRFAAPACLRACAVTSGRRWEKHGVLPTIVLMWRLRAAYFFGADPDQLAVRYGYAPRQR
ncbi:MAG: glycosyl transferase family 2 [Proteobacteria bacterium]|nr:glycosyl transferase family 2 [Pseudomonadota bacterium]MBS1229256.1 glycosyl transferase family 2 [Pseudomonadota bacterium]